MARLVIMAKGEWAKSQQGVWRFEEDTTVMSQSILVKKNEQYASLELKVRGLFNIGQQTPLVLTFQLPQWMVEPDGETCPPHTIRSNPDIDMLMSVHEWNNEPKICIISGPKEVAKYHYLCRSPFTIGRHTFLADGVTEEQHLATINDIMSRGRLMCSEEVVTEFNDPEKVMLLYRFSMEIEKARASLDLNVDIEPRVGDHIVPNVNNPPGLNPAIPHAYQFTGNVGLTMVEENAGISPVSVFRNTYAPSPYGAVTGGYIPFDGARYWEMRPGYYENLMASGYALELARIYGVPGSEFTGYHVGDLNIVNSGDQEIPQYQVPMHVSSTGSSTELNTGVEIRGQQQNFAERTATGQGGVISQIGQTSRQVIGGAIDIKGKGQETNDVTTQVEQRNVDDLADGTCRSEQGGK